MYKKLGRVLRCCEKVPGGSYTMQYPQRSVQTRLLYESVAVNVCLLEVALFYLLSVWTESK